MTPIKLPSLGYFKNGNGWLGSSGILRFQIEKPVFPETPEGAGEEGPVPSMSVVLWQGPFSRPYAREIGRESFPVTEEGLNALLGFLSTRARELEEQPTFTAEETTAFYQEKKAEEKAAAAE